MWSSPKLPKCKGSVVHNGEGVECTIGDGRFLEVGRPQGQTNLISRFTDPTDPKFWWESKKITIGSKKKKSI